MAYQTKIPLKMVTYKDWTERLRKVNFQRKLSNDHFKSPALWKQNIRKWEVMEDICTILYVFIKKKLLIALIVQTLSKPVHWLQLAKVKPDWTVFSYCCCWDACQSKKTCYQLLCPDGWTIKKKKKKVCYAVHYPETKTCFCPRLLTCFLIT